MILTGIPTSFFALRPKQPFRALGRILPEPVGKNTLTEDLAASVATLPRTSLDAMDAVQLMRRFDTKYVLPESWLPDLFETMAPHAHVLEVDGHVESRYDNLYFELPGDQFLQDHLRGKARRMKVRSRTYGSNGLTFLEVKERVPGGRTEKHRTACPEGVSSELTAEQLTFLEQHLDRAKALEARLHGAFQRTTLVDFDRQERVTIDRGLQAGLVGHDSAPLLEGLAVIEIKQPRPDRYTPLQKWLRNLTDRKGAIGRSTRMSKYTMARLDRDPDIAGRAYLATYRRLMDAQSWAGDLQA